MPDGEDRPWTRGEVVPLRAVDGAAGSSRSLWCDAAEWVEEEVPARPWLVRGYLLRGSVTLVSGAGAAGKSMLIVGWLVALALGQPWGKFAAGVPLRSLAYNVEDDRTEQQLRISACLRQWGRTPRDLGGRFVRCGPVGSGLLLTFDPVSQTVSPTSLMESLLAEIESRRPDVLALDPLVEIHGAGENDNTALRAVVAYFRSFALQYQLAVVIVHHARKGGSQPGDPDSVRGASAIIGAARVVLTVQEMGPEEALELGIPNDARRDYARVDGAKSNYAPAREAEWFKKQEYLLDNTEWVSALVPWRPPGAESASQETIAAILAAIEAGTEGEPWSPKLSGDPRSIRTLLRRHGVTARQAEAATIQALEAAGIRIGTYRTVHRQLKQGYRGERGPDCRWVETC